MGLFSFLRPIFEPKPQMAECERQVLADPVRVAALTGMAKALIDAGGITAEEATWRVLHAVPADEIELLDTHDGRTAILCDAAEAMFAPPVVQTRRA